MRGDVEIGRGRLKSPPPLVSPTPSDDVSRKETGTSSPPYFTSEDSFCYFRSTSLDQSSGPHESLSVKGRGRELPQWILHSPAEIHRWLHRGKGRDYETRRTGSEVALKCFTSGPHLGTRSPLCPPDPDLPSSPPRLLLTLVPHPFPAPFFLFPCVTRPVPDSRPLSPFPCREIRGLGGQGGGDGTSRARSGSSGPRHFGSRGRGGEEERRSLSATHLIPTRGTQCRRNVPSPFPVFTVVSVTIRRRQYLLGGRAPARSLSDVPGDSTRPPPLGTNPLCTLVLPSSHPFLFSSSDYTRPPLVLSDPSLSPHPWERSRTSQMGVPAFLGTTVPLPGTETLTCRKGDREDPVASQASDPLSRH